MQLEQPAQKCLRVVAREVTALDERDGVRKVGEGEAARQARAVRGLSRIRSRHELTRRAAT